MHSNHAGTRRQLTILPALVRFRSPAVKSLGTSLLGIAERLIDRDYGSISLQDINVSIRAAGLVVAEHTWTFRDQFNAQTTYLAWLFQPGSLVKIHESIANLLGRVSGKPEDVELVCNTVF